MSCKLEQSLKIEIRIYISKQANVGCNRLNSLDYKIDNTDKCSSVFFLVCNCQLVSDFAFVAATFFKSCNTETFFKKVVNCQLSLLKKIFL